MFPILTQALAYLSRVCGFETIDAFPAGHKYARTHWNAAYFDIASDFKPERIEQTLCDKISNTPAIFAHISSPTPRMQRALLAVIEERTRHAATRPTDLVTLLMNAFHSPYTVEAMPGLRRAIEDSEGDARAVLDFLGGMSSAFDIIDAEPSGYRPHAMRSLN